MYTFRCVLNKCLSSCFSNFLDTLQIWPNLGGTPRLINEVQTICLSKYFCSIENRNLSVAGSSMNSTFSSQMIKQLCDVLNNILCPLWFFGANKCTQLVCRSPSSSPSRSHTSYVTESPKTLTTSAEAEQRARQRLRRWFSSTNPAIVVTHISVSHLRMWSCEREANVCGSGMARESRTERPKPNELETK